MIINFNKYNENFDNKKLFLMAENVDIKLYENENKETCREIVNKVINDSKINFVYITTFGLGVNAFLPVVQELLKNGNIIINDESVTLLVITALAILANERKDEIKRVINILKEKGIFNFLNDVIKLTKSIKDIFKYITKGFDKLISFTMDMFAYTALVIPFLDVIHHIVINKGYTIKDILIMGASLALGTLTLIVKHFVNELYNKLKFKIENVSKLQNNQNIENHKISKELTGPKSDDVDDCITSFEKFNRNY